MNEFEQKIIEERYKYYISVRKNYTLEAEKIMNQIKDGYDPISLKPKDLLDRYTINPLSLRLSLHLAKNLIEVIIEYNESKRK